MAMARCPTCDKNFASESSPALPFCSDRCRQIDLKRWLNEEISMPVDSSEEDPGPQREEKDAE
jgi:hypothetical protein